MFIELERIGKLLASNYNSYPNVSKRDFSSRLLSSFPMCSKMEHVQFLHNLFLLLDDKITKNNRNKCGYAHKKTINKQNN